VREELITLRAVATLDNDAHALARLDQAERQIVQWEQAAPALAAAEALVVEAEELATGTPIDDAQLPARWQAVDLAARTPALTRRFEAALLVIEQRRLAYVRATQQEQGAARQQLHAALHEAEQALAAGQLQEARAAADRTRALKPLAGLLPKPSVQRLSRLVQQLVELERWQQFGQQTARVQLCERAEGLAQQGLAPVALAREVQQLRAEWKKLDEQHAGVPKALWERFDGACERAYAPAARHFAEQAAQHKQARKQREEFITAAAAHTPTLLGEPRDWRAIERWLRDTESTGSARARGVDRRGGSAGSQSSRARYAFAREGTAGALAGSRQVHRARAAR
jgi:DNA repair protein SbcC/Rad50